MFKLESYHKKSWMSFHSTLITSYLKSSYFIWMMALAIYYFKHFFLADLCQKWQTWPVESPEINIWATTFLEANLKLE